MEPIKIKLSFEKVVELYRERFEEETSGFKKLYLSSILRIADENPELQEGIDENEIEQYEEPISILLNELFPEALTSNEIKAAYLPFSDVLFNVSKRLKQILKNAGDGFELKIITDDEFDVYQLAFGFILNKFYDHKIGFTKPLIRQIPDKNGFERSYRLMVNAQFIDVKRNEGARELSEEDVHKLLRNPDDQDLWKEYLPLDAYTFHGFAIVNFTDVTVDHAISELKTILLGSATTGENQSEEIQKIFRNMFGLEQLRVGYTAFDKFDRTLETITYNDSESFILGDSHAKQCTKALCSGTYNHLIKQREPLIITDVEDYSAQEDNKFLTKNLLKEGIHSAILYPILKGKELIGILEVVSTKKYALNSFNVRKIEGVVDYIKAAVIRSEQEYLNRIKALIQTECTSIHHSVQWKFEKEARKILRHRDQGQKMRTFKDVRFPDIYPLYGQIDIVGSSDARNNSIKNDLIGQLDLVCEIFASAKAKETLPIYDQIIYRVNEYKEELVQGNIDANSERNITKLLTEEINPIMHHVKDISKDLDELVTAYESKIDGASGVIYNTRNSYDDTVQSINESLSAFLDSKQLEAQKIYPHYFERFKTDGVEHNIYVGASITPDIDFNIVYLYNMRLWQLQTMIQMERRFYELQKEMPVKVEAASMILVFDSTLSIRYRIDEKRFDVDGTYNARYEVIKKRIDKAHIKDTEERITQKGKLAIIYTNDDTEREYLRYINFLQYNQMISENVEIVELEDVQGVIGLKAIRVEILYNRSRSEDRLTYQNLVKELHPEPSQSQA
jgi:hypothetical protein